MAESRLQWSPREEPGSADAINPRDQTRKADVITYAFSEDRRDEQTEDAADRPGVAARAVSPGLVAANQRLRRAIMNEKGGTPSICASCITLQPAMLFSWQQPTSACGAPL
jgi:hypothetical protein